MRFCIFLFLMLGFSFGHAQNDYLVLHQGDTLHAKHIRVKSRITKFKSPSGRQKLPTREIKEIRQNGKKYWIYEDCEGDLDAFWVLMEGKVSLLHSEGNHEGYCPDAVVINHQIYSIEKKRFFSDEAWKIMADCAVFAEKYSDYYNEHRNKVIVFHRHYRQVRTKWMEIIRFYNANCGG